MNWKLSFQLSMFGLIMAFGTIALIPDKIEPLFWLVIFVACAYVIAKVCTRNYFWQGFWVSMFNSVWLTATHIIFYKSYAAHHADMVKSFDAMPFHEHHRLTQLIMGPIIGAICGLVQGLFAFIASKLVKTKVVQQ